MIVKHTCPVCGQHLCTDLKLYGQVDVCDGSISSSISSIDVRDTCTEEEFVDSIISSLRPHISDGIKVSELYTVLQETYGLHADFCYEVVQKIKTELGMYSPNRVQLYYVE